MTTTDEDGTETETERTNDLVSLGFVCVCVCNSQITFLRIVPCVTELRSVQTAASAVYGSVRKFRYAEIFEYFVSLL